MLPLLHTRVQTKDSVKYFVCQLLCFLFIQFIFVHPIVDSLVTGCKGFVSEKRRFHVYSPCHLPSLLVYPLAGCQETETSLPQVNLRAQLLNLLKSEEALLAAGADDPDGIMSVVFFGSMKT